VWFEFAPFPPPKQSFAPRCYTCNTINKQIISIDGPAAFGKKPYHIQHFFGSEGGEPFLDPSLLMLIVLSFF